MPPPPLEVPPAPPVVAIGKLPLKSSVGQGGVNDPMDVGLLKRRLIALGFEWLTPNQVLDPDTVGAISLIQAIVRGRQSIPGPGVDGRMDVGGETHRWLEAVNAPR